MQHMPSSISAGDDHTAAPGENDAVETAMGTGSDEGAPGEHRPGPPLTPGESDLLDRLREQPAGKPLEAVEDSTAMTAAAEDDAVLPGFAGNDSGAGAADADVPAFVEPAGS